MITIDASPLWLTTRRLSVYYDNLCPETFVGPAQCYFVLHVLGPDGAPISGVTLSSKAKRSPEEKTEK